MDLRASYCFMRQDGAGAVQAPFCTDRAFVVAVRWDPHGLWAHFPALCGHISLCVSWAGCGGLSSALLQSFGFSISTIFITPSQDMSKGSLPLPVSPVNIPEFSYYMKIGYCIKL